MIYIIDDDDDFADVVARVCKKTLHEQCDDSLHRSACEDSSHGVVRKFSDVIAAINAMADEVPDLIFLDVLLSGPDGFTLLNEMQSYPDLARVPVVLMSSLDFKEKNLRHYGVVGALYKSDMKPDDVATYVKKYAQKHVKKNDAPDNAQGHTGEL